MPPLFTLPQRKQALGYLSMDDDTVRHAALLMEENLEAPLNIAVIAKIIGQGTPLTSLEVASETTVQSAAGGGHLVGSLEPVEQVGKTGMAEIDQPLAPRQARDPLRSE